MKLLEILRESLDFLRKYPKFFIPSLVSTTIWTAFYILLFETLTTITLTNYTSIITSSLPSLLLLIMIFSPVSVLIYSMYPTLVKDYREKKSFSFKKAFGIAVKRFPKAFAAMVLPSLLLSIVASPFVGILLIGILRNNYLFMFLGGISTAIIFVLFTVMFYFAHTSVIINKSDVFSSFKESWGLGRENFKELSLIIIFSLIVLIIGYTVPGRFKFAGIVGFIFGRYLQGILETYLKIINPNLYLKIE